MKRLFILLMILTASSAIISSDKNQKEISDKNKKQALDSGSAGSAAAEQPTSQKNFFIIKIDKHLTPFFWNQRDEIPDKNYVYIDEIPGKNYFYIEFFRKGSINFETFYYLCHETNPQPDGSLLILIHCGKCNHDCSNYNIKYFIIDLIGKSHKYYESEIELGFRYHITGTLNEITGTLDEIEIKKEKIS